MKRKSCVALIMLLSLGVPRPVFAQPPSEYADLYAFLDRRLTAADRVLSSRWNGQRFPVVFAAELLAANGNQGERLLTEQTWQGVLVNLDRLQLLGVRGVKLAIVYPILLPGFPRSAEYLAFYKRLADEVRRRGLKILVGMGPAFKPSALGALPVQSYYASLTFQRYKHEKRQMAETIIREIRPDFLTIENEPHTAWENTGLPFTVATFTEVVRTVLDGLDRSGVLVGAGAGTWDGLAYFESLARSTTVDYLDLHLYPINFDFLLDRPFRIAELAERYGKRLILGEAWLYKARDWELLVPALVTATELFSRDVFSFWEPLDVRFVEVVGKLAHALRLELASFFWMRYFFGYVEYTAATKGLSASELFLLANQAAVQNMLRDPPRLTRTGEAFHRLVSEASAASRRAPSRAE